MNDALLPFFARRYEMTDDEAAGVLRALAEDPALRLWLREQLEMEDLIARLLQPERGDFTNRVRSSLAHGRDTDRFVARVQDLVTSQANGRMRAPSQRFKKPGGALPFPRRLFTPWGLAACATVLVLVTAALVVSLRPGSRHLVLEGDIAVGNAAVHDIPEGRDFTVTGNAPAVVRLGVGAQAEFSPASTARIRPATRTSSQVVQLGAGSGAFHLGQGNHELRVETALGSITGSGADAAFTATVDAEPAAAVKPNADGSPGPAVDTAANGVLTVSVHNGSAHVEVHGKKQLILADEARVFSMVGGALTDERSFKGQLKSLTPSGPVANVTISDHSNKLITIAIAPTTLVQINGLTAAPGDLKLGERIEVRTAKDTPTIATLIIVAKHHEAKKIDPVHPAAIVPVAPHVPP
jgi:hypothetical protein